MTQVPEQRRPGVGGLPVAVRDRDELLLAVEAHTDDHETAQPFLLEANVEVDPVSPEVHVVPVRQVAGHEGAVLVLPGRGEPGDHRSRQPSRRTEEPLEGRDEVACRQSVQVQQRQDLGDLRRPPTPRRDDDGLELGLFTGRLVDTTVVHPRCFDLDRSGHGLDLASPGVAISRHETVPVLIALVYELGEIRVDLGLQGSGQHRPRTFAADLVQAEATFRASLGVVHYAQHRRPFLAGALTPAARLGFQRGRYVAPPDEWVIHNFRSYLTAQVGDPQGLVIFRSHGRTSAVGDNREDACLPGLGGAVRSPATRCPPLRGLSAHDRGDLHLVVRLSGAPDVTVGTTRRPVAGPFFRESRWPGGHPRPMKCVVVVVGRGRRMILAAGSASLV